MKVILFFLILILFGCQANNNSTNQEKSGERSPTKNLPVSNHQWNISILLDLSDRISPEVNPATPQHYERDLEIIKKFAEIIKEDIFEKKLYRAAGKIQIIFSPAPEDPNINKLAKDLIIDLQGTDITRKKEVYENITTDLPANANKIYDMAIANKNWIGADIWRFFKNDVKDLCVSRDSSYRNILVILTDGYIYHKNSMDSKGNKYAYILPSLFEKYKLRNSNNWEQDIDNKKFGLIATRSELQDLEVLVLEITPSEQHKNDEDIIKKILSDWFTEMNVKRFEIYNTALPEYTKSRIENFLND